MTDLGKGLVDLQTAINGLAEAVANKDAAETLAKMGVLRSVADALEKIVSNDRWPLPKYREMLFLY